jgi:exodeoxyribonuclease X
MTRVIRIVDFETNGTEPPAEVIEVGHCDLTEDGADWVVGRPVSRLCGADRLTCETRAIHHIHPSEVAGLDPFYAQPYVQQAKSDGIIAIAAHHADFEGKWLGPVLAGMPMICTYKAALRVWPDAPEHKNQFFRYWLEDQGITAPDAALAQPAHRAGPDAYATAWLLKALLAHASVDDLIAWNTEPAALPRCPIGKWRGSPWSQVDAGFLDWMTKQATMERDLKWNADRELRRRRDQLRPR